MIIITTILILIVLYYCQRRRHDGKVEKMENPDLRESEGDGATTTALVLFASWSMLAYAQHLGSHSCFLWEL